jgi:hypothetical protein
VIVGPDGAPWITDGGLNAIVRVDPGSSDVRRYPLPAGRGSANLNTAVFDRRGVLWFTGQSGVYGRLDPATGAMEVFDAPRGSGPYGITVTPSGDVYYASLAGSHVARIDTDTGTATVLEPPTASQGTRRVWADSRGRIWSSQWNAGQVAVYDPRADTWREWRLPGDRPQAYAVYVDERDVVWLSDFGANADELFFEWWYRPDDGSLNVPPPDLVKSGQPNPWKLFPDPTGNRGKGRHQVLLKGNPNAPEALLADTWWFCRYRHKNDDIEATNWKVPQKDATGTVIADAVNFTWAGAGNSDPFNDFDGDGIKDFRAQLAQGWIKRVLDAVNPYEARIRSFEDDNPSTRSSMLAQFGPRFEGPVALNPDKNVIENVGLIELYETILKRGRDLSIDLTRPVSTPAIANALLLDETGVSDFYTILGNEAYADAIDPTIGFSAAGQDLSGANAGYGSLASAVFSFQNQMSSLLGEELALLHGVDDFFARPVYNRLFWNFTKGEGEAAYAINYNLTDINLDGLVANSENVQKYDDPPLRRLQARYAAHHRRHPLLPISQRLNQRRLLLKARPLMRPTRRPLGLPPRRLIDAVFALDYESTGEREMSVQDDLFVGIELDDEVDDLSRVVDVVDRGHEVLQITQR